jgi:hypothetical protein
VGIEPTTVRLPKVASLKLKVASLKPKVASLKPKVASLKPKVASLKSLTLYLTELRRLNDFWYAETLTAEVILVRGDDYPQCEEWDLNP